MKQFINEYRLLKKDMVKLTLFIIVMAVIDSSIYLKNSTPYEMSSSGEVLGYLFSTTQDYGNWVYWIIFLVGYIVMLQIIWKKYVHTFEINQLLKNQNVKYYWYSKAFMGIIMTAVYSGIYIITTETACLLVGIPFNLEGIEIIIFTSLSINLFLHGSLWLIVKNFIRVEVANILILLLIYIGTKMDSPFIPLYYAMVGNMGLSVKWITIVFIQLIFIVFMWWIILIKAKKMDYM